MISYGTCEELKERLVAAAKSAEENGLCLHKSGNFSICVRTEGVVLISPSGFCRAHLVPDDIIITSLAGDILENKNSRKPSIELMMHIAVYEARPDACAIVHTHSHYATAFAVKGRKISPVVTEAVFYGKNVELAEYAEAGSPQLAENIKEPIRKADVCLLKNHGVITISGTIESALLKAFYVEDVAKIEAISTTL